MHPTSANFIFEILYILWRTVVKVQTSIDNNPGETVCVNLRARCNVAILRENQPETRQNLLKLAYASSRITFEVMARSCVISQALIGMSRCKQQLLKLVAARSIIM